MHDLLLIPKNSTNFATDFYLDGCSLKMAKGHSSEIVKLNRGTLYNTP